MSSLLSYPSFFLSDLGVLAVKFFNGIHAK